MNFCISFNKFTTHEGQSGSNNCKKLILLHVLFYMYYYIIMYNFLLAIVHLNRVPFTLFSIPIFNLATVILLVWSPMWSPWWFLRDWGPLHVQQAWDGILVPETATRRQGQHLLEGMEEEKKGLFSWNILE